MKVGKGNAHGKIILIGEHAVVYGEKAIALPFFPTTCTVLVTPASRNLITSAIFKGIIEEAPQQMDSIIALINELVRHLNLPPLHYHIDSNISIGAGMGSSAAIASAITRSVYAYMNLYLSDVELFNWIQYSEKIAHGNPSGIDALTTSHNNAWIFQKGKSPIKFETKLDAYLIVGESGEIGNTLAAVSHVRELIKEAGKMALINEIGVAVEAAILAYQARNVINLGRVMNTAQSCLKSLGVSTPKIDLLVGLALSNGAVGAKLTGGGFGGCVIALASNQEIAELIKSEWERSTLHTAWILNLNEG